MAPVKIIKHIYLEHKTKGPIEIPIHTILKFIYSEKATVVKNKVEISQNFVAFSEYMNFIINPNFKLQTAF